jgi:hypothetical protein
MNRKRKPQQRKRANKKVVRNHRGKRLAQHQLDVRVKRREGAGVRRHFRLPLIAKVAGIAAVVAVVAFVTSNVLGRFLWNNPAYTLTTIEFETDGWLTRPIALETAEVDSGVNVLRLDLEDIRDRLIGLPQVKDATVVRVLPDKLGISVKERHPIAWLDCPEQNIYPKVKSNGILLDQEGVALPCQQMRQEYVNFPSIAANGLAAIKSGMPVGSDQLVSALELVTVSGEMFCDHGLEIVEIKLVNDYSMLARFNNHTKVTFKPSEIGRQVEDLRGIFEDSLRKNRLLETVNLLPERNIAITFARNPRPTAIPRAIPRAIPVGRGSEATAESQPPRRAVRALRSIPARSTSTASGAIDPDLSSILNRQ